ncbi:hypothetical protein C5167_004553 [Papaver somniferum]|uniref:Uncharacterized protein n=1 Tax=Papaver somniferum TaxID=3469 RepID=A0A4Y7JBS4_PAPSO|nr:hypothetical protein C5167_004553 [Papaver somniferum]
MGSTGPCGGPCTETHFDTFGNQDVASFVLLRYVTQNGAGRVLIRYISLFGLTRSLGISDAGRVCCKVLTNDTRRHHLL